MSELKFNNYNPKIDSVYDIGNGVVPEMAKAFGYDLTSQPEEGNLGELIGKIGPAKTLQDNIGKVQAVLGVTDAAREIAIDWVDRSGLLIPVERSYINPDQKVPPSVDKAVISGGVRNWMQRRADLLIKASDHITPHRIVLVAGNRIMNQSEGSDVAEAMTEANYLEKIIAAKLQNIGKFALIDVVKVESGVGDEVMDKVARAVGSTAVSLVISNAGAWVQNAGQFRRAQQRVGGEYDSDGTQLFVMSDEFPLARENELASTHQNPYTALGQIARNAQELVRHQ